MENLPEQDYSNAQPSPGAIKSALRRKIASDVGDPQSYLEQFRTHLVYWLQWHLPTS